MPDEFEDFTGDLGSTESTETQDSKPQPVVESKPEVKTDDIEGLKTKNFELIGEKRAERDRRLEAERRAEEAERKLSERQEAKTDTRATDSDLVEIDSLDKEFDTLEEKADNAEITNEEYHSKRRVLEKRQRVLLKKLAERPEKVVNRTFEERDRVTQEKTKVTQQAEQESQGLAEVSAMITDGLSDMFFVPESESQWVTILDNPDHPKHAQTVNTYKIVKTAVAEKKTVEQILSLWDIETAYKLKSSRKAKAAGSDSGKPKPDQRTATVRSRTSADGGEGKPSYKSQRDEIDEIEREFAGT